MREIFNIETICEPRMLEMTKLNGETTKRLCIGMVLVAAGQSVFAEMFGEMAEEFAREQCDTGTLIQADIEFKVRSWQNAGGGTSYGTNARVRNFSIIRKEERSF